LKGWGDRQSPEENRFRARLTFPVSVAAWISTSLLAQLEVSHEVCQLFGSRQLKPVIE
jgi:hypothetical protein